MLPGESPAVFGDALRRMAAAATYLYQDGPRYWYSTQPTVTKLADDRAEQLAPHLVEHDPRSEGDRRVVVVVRAHLAGGHGRERRRVIDRAAGRRRAVEVEADQVGALVRSAQPGQ